MIVAIVGMPGSGKSEASKAFVKAGFELVYFGNTVIEELKGRGLEVSEKNEKAVREDLRQKHGMAAMALVNIPKIEKMIAEGKNVLIDGLYSWEEFVELRKKFSELKLVAISTSPKTRYKRLAERSERPLTKAEAKARDKAEIEKLNKGGPIAAADFSVSNEGSKEDLRKEIESVLEKLK
ncbi:MAG: AAA family ATPase [archaeon]|jgi:dephospho-CoA kinase|nr:AAA family ATPase [archaeon]